jgi:hypothetical protein
MHDVSCHRDVNRHVLNDVDLVVSCPWHVGDVRMTYTPFSFLLTVFGVATRYKYIIHGAMVLNKSRSSYSYDIHSAMARYTWEVRATQPKIILAKRLDHSDNAINSHLFRPLGQPSHFCREL